MTERLKKDSGTGLGDPHSQRLAIGTAQFGLHYGIANQTGKIGLSEARAILLEARAHGVDTLDTAIAYGQSEKTLGALGVSDWRLISKLPPLPDDVQHIESWVHGRICESVKLLKVRGLYAVLLHKPEQLLGSRGNELYYALHKLKADGLVENVGVSVYGPEELDLLLREMRFDLVQAPINIFDQRIVTSGWVRQLHSDGVKLHVRSVFLQGLLLMGAKQRPRKFDRWNSLWSRWESWLADNKLSPLQACLRYAMSIQEAHKIVVGVDSLNQFKEILSTLEGGIPSLPRWEQPIEADLVNPARWSQL